MIAEIIVDVARSETDKIFDYIATEQVEIGCRVIVPFGKIKIAGICVGLKEKSDFSPDKLKSVIRVLDEQPALTKEVIALMGFMVKRYHVPRALALRQFLPSEMRKGKVRAKTVKYCSLIKYDFSQIKSNANAQREALNYLNEVKRGKLSVLNDKFSSSAIKALEGKGLVEIIEERVNRLPYSDLSLTAKKVDYTSEQINAINDVESDGKKVDLIFGVTGSGKTEVYLNLIEKTLQRGKTVIMAVPEISLTPQMLSLLRARFREKVSILHSGLTAGERFDEWWRLRSGEAKIAIGARSVIFAPLENLGLIVIDEQHDSSYESESAPRYSTFEIASFRAEYNSCKIVLGSATPSVEVFLRAKNGEYGLIKMNNRINKRSLPEIICADMRREVKRGNPSCYSGVLKLELEACLSRGEQAMIFLNRRGYSKQVICSSCGYVAKCEQCDVALNYHSDCNLLKCHYCGTAYKMLTACPECGNVNLLYGGTGTQRVVEELKKLFPTARILRMDNDTTQNKDGHFKILNAFSEHKADILVGTQMIAKGHDFSNVTLVGILDGDMSLFFSDYRSSERTFQLLTQVAGRSGRGEKKGKVVLQTFSPDNPVLSLSMKYDYEGLYEREIALRKATGFPPFSDIVRIMVEGEEENLAIETLKNLYLECKELFNQNMGKFYFFNKMKSPVKRIKRKFRFQILMRIKSGNKDLIDKFYELAEKYNGSKVYVYLEENPASLV